MNKCCEDKTNRVTVSVEESVSLQGKSVKKVEICSVCNLKHYTLYAEPLVLEMEENG